MTETQQQITKVTEQLAKFLIEKNKRYGDSALHPINIFSKSGAADGLYKRADDKLSRIQNNPKLQKNDVVDLMGYCTLICIDNGWLDFTDQQD